MIWQTLFALGLLVGVALAHHRRCPLLLRSAYVLAANAVACNIAAVATGSYDPVFLYAGIDVASALVMLWHPAGRTQAILGLIYIVQLGLHFGHWAAGATHVASYTQMLWVGGSLQIAFLIMGAIRGDGRKVADWRGVRGGDGVAVAHVAARLGGEE